MFRRRPLGVTMRPRMAKKKQASQSASLAAWEELDLTRAAAEGKLPRAFEVDEVIDQVTEVLNAGRIPVLTGESGIGKTAVVYEMARRAAAGEGPAALRGRRIVQFSFARRAAGLRKPDEQMRPEVLKLVEALLRGEGDVAPFFRDLHLAYQFDVEAQLELLALRMDQPVLAEGERSMLESMFEFFPGLQNRYVLVHMGEPDAERSRRILTQWAEEQRFTTGVTFDASAIDASLTLTHRFLSRSRMPRKGIDLLNQVGALVGPERAATSSDVIERFCRSHNVPRVLVDPLLPLDLQQVEAKFRSELLGQQEAVSALVSIIGLVKAGLSDLRRPFGVFMFVGPTGVGKTHAAQLLAQYLFGGRERVIRINMADYPDESGAFTLFGMPGEYGARRQGMLTHKLAGRPFAVLLLDEFEKAHPKVHDRFLQLFDEGSFINAAGETVACRSLIVIATSNAGAEVYRTGAFGFAASADRAWRDAEAERRLHEHFRFEFLNRFDRVVHFRPLSREDIRTIALRELEQLRERNGLRQRGLELEVDESVLDWLAVNGYDPDNGARFLRRTIEKHVTTALADAIVRDNPPPGTTVRLTVRQNVVVARPVEAPAPAPVKLTLELPRGAGVEVAALDRAGLEAEATRILEDAAPLMRALEEKRGERSVLLERMNEPGFWEDATARRGVLDRFRSLDVSVRIEERFARAVSRLGEVLRGDGEAADHEARLARALERAAGALQDWRTRMDEEGAGPVWVVISNADAMRAAGEWIEDLTRMELAWCRRMHLQASVVAFDEGDGELRRVVIEVDGPGASAFMEMEEGMHRLRRPKSKDARARIDIVPRGPSPESEWEGMRPMVGRGARFGVRPEWRGRLELEEQGVVVQLAAADARVLSHLLHDLREAWGGSGVAAGEAETARVYGENGAWARDPRTEAPATRLKDVLEGRLDGFLEAWKRRARAGV